MINVKEIMRDPSEVMDIETIVKPRVPDAKEAFRRIQILKYKLDDLSDFINSTNVDNTEASWHLAYAQLTGAFKECIREEKKIIAES